MKVYYLFWLLSGAKRLLLEEPNIDVKYEGRKSTSEDINVFSFTRNARKSLKVDDENWERIISFPANKVHFVQLAPKNMLTSRGVKKILHTIF